MNKNKGEIWGCDYCDSDFDSRESVEKHEAICPKRIFRIKGKVKPVLDIWQGFKFGLGFAAGVLLFYLLVFFIFTLFFAKFLGSMFSGFS